MRKLRLRNHGLGRSHTRKRWSWDSTGSVWGSQFLSTTSHNTFPESLQHGFFLGEDCSWGRVLEDKGGRMAEQAEHRCHSRQIGQEKGKHSSLRN
jgi:hypothetical protein